MYCYILFLQSVSPPSPCDFDDKVYKFLKKIQRVTSILSVRPSTLTRWGCTNGLGGWGFPLYELYRYVPGRSKVYALFSCFDLKVGTVSSKPRRRVKVLSFSSSNKKEKEKDAKNDITKRDLHRLHKRKGSLGLNE